MTTLLLRLAGPMQSWGTQSRFTDRDTGREPSKSGVLGLVASALGRPRDADLSDLAALRLGVRVDREGEPRRDFQTAGGGKWPSGRYYVAIASSKPGQRVKLKSDPVISARHYLADADFLIGLEGPDDLLTRIDEALSAPKWPLFLGRKSYVPSEPVRIRDGLSKDVDLLSALRTAPWRARDRREAERARENLRLRAVLDSEEKLGATRVDVPVSFSQRKFAPRVIRTEWIVPERILEPEGGP